MVNVTSGTFISLVPPVVLVRTRITEVGHTPT